VHVLGKIVQAVRPGGIVLDLQVIRPNPRVEIDGHPTCEIDGWPLFRKADAATAAVDALILARRLLEEAVDEHDVRTHYPNGADLVEDFAVKERRLPDEAIASLEASTLPCVVRERCRLRRLAVPDVPWQSAEPHRADFLAP
jgi:hypothetical protein